MNKNLILLLSAFIILALQSSTYAQVQFSDTSIKKSFEKGRNENKAVFIEIYADGCHHCEAFKKTFDTNKNVGSFFNSNFVSYQVEVNSVEGRKFRKDMNINVMSTPLMTFWSADSTLLSILPAGDEQNNELAILDFGKRALDPKSQWKTQKSAFHQDENDPNFLINLAYLARYTSDTLLNIAAANKYTTILSLDNFKNDGFLVIQKVLMDFDNPLFLYCINNLELYYSKYGQKEVNTAIENIIMFSLYSSRADNFGLSKLEFMKSVLAKIGIEKKAILGRFLLIEAKALLKLDKKQEVLLKFKEYAKSKIKVEKEELGFINAFLTKNLIETDWLNEYK
jgi:thioredoxin-related protein